MGIQDRLLFFPCLLNPLIILQNQIISQQLYRQKNTLIFLSEKYAYFSVSQKNHYRKKMWFLNELLLLKIEKNTLYYNAYSSFEFYCLTGFSTLYRNQRPMSLWWRYDVMKPMSQSNKRNIDLWCICVSTINFHPVNVTYIECPTGKGQQNELLLFKRDERDVICWNLSITKDVILNEKWNIRKKTVQKVRA